MASDAGSEKVPREPPLLGLVRCVIEVSVTALVAGQCRRVSSFVEGTGNPSVEFCLHRKLWPAVLLQVRSSIVPWVLMAVWFAGFAAVALNQYLRRRRFRALIEEAQFLK